MSDNYIKKQVEAIRYHSDRLVKSYGGGSYCLKCDNCIDKHPCHICNPEPTIKVSELRGWCEAIMKENEENIEFHLGSNDYEDIEESIESSSQNDLIQELLTKFCGGK